MSVTDIYDTSNRASDSSISDYFSLLKPRVMSLVVFSGVAGMWVAPGLTDMHPLLAIVSILALALGAGAAGAVNMWYDRDIDSVMDRTKNRAIPAGKIAPDDALTFAVVCSVAAVILLGLASNWLAAGILAFANFFYSVVYTMGLKRTTPQNIVIGGAAGAFPPMIGWAAVTGDVTLYPLIMFAVIFFWTPPHFWALSLFANHDYEKAGIPMLPVVKGERVTRRSILLYTMALCALTFLPYVLGYTGTLYLIGSSLLSFIFLAGSFQVWARSKRKDAVQLFAYSIFYLFAWFALIMLEHSLGV